MTTASRRFDPIRSRIAPLILVIVGVDLILVYGFGMSSVSPAASPSWWSTLFLQLLAVALTAIAVAVAIEPRPILVRRALAGAALVWLIMMAIAVVTAVGQRRSIAEVWPILAIVAAIGVALAMLASTTDEVTDDATPALGRVAAVVVFAIAIVVAAAAAIIVADLASTAISAITQGADVERLPWLAVVAVIVLPILAFSIAALDSRRAAGGTFYAQAAANRRNSVLLLITLVGVVAATAEIIAVTLTFDPIPALWVAGAAALVGFGAAAGASRFGSTIILESAGAKRADETGDRELVDVVRELSLAANLPPPVTYVIEDGSQNAFATGRDPEHASLAVTRGLLERMDREQLQGVIGHELGHVRNLDTRYALYVAVLVGLVAIVTDGFLRMIVEAWRHGAFYWKGEGKNAAGALVAGLCVGLFLLIVAALLRLLAPLFSALVQAASSRQREFLADATSVEFTRNAHALERALTSIAADSDTLEAANRGTQHLWFRNPVKAGSDRRASLFSTHPSLAARIDRLRTLQGLGPIDPDAAATTSAET